MSKTTKCRQCEKLEKKIENLESCLKIISTWAEFDCERNLDDTGRAIVPEHVRDMIDETFKRVGNKKAEEAKHGGS